MLIFNGLHNVEEWRDGLRQGANLMDAAPTGIVRSLCRS